MNELSEKAQQRKSIRQSIRAKRNALPSLFQQQASASLVSELTNIKKIREATKIAIYLTNDSELNTTPFIQWCWKNHIETYLPVIHPFCKGHLLFILYHQQTSMVENQYGILEPKLNVQNVIPPQNIDIIFTPLVAFDNQGSRLGMGGGYYDRTLAALNNFTVSPHIIGLAHDCQQVEAVPTESWDIPIPEVITPSKHFKFI